MRRNIAQLSADDLWSDWQRDIERITKDSYELFTIRRQFREIAEMFEQNKQLQTSGANLWQWLRLLYATTTLMRFRREVDTQGNTVNLRTLLEEIEKRPDVITRHRIASRPQGRGQAVSDLMARLLDESFTKEWAVSSAAGAPNDQIDPERVRTDRIKFEELTAELDEITSRTIAHRQRVPPAKTTVAGVDAIFVLFEELLKKYLGLLTGVSLVNAEPTAQYDTFEPFTFPWHPRAYQEWIELRRPNVRDHKRDGT